MELIRVVGGAPLVGEVSVTGAKNSVLKLMAASLLAEGTTTITAVPHILDVDDMGVVLNRLGAQAEHAGDSVTIEVPDTLSHEIDYTLVRRMRAAINLLGPLLARCGQARVALPGGDNIGSRALDMHISGLTKMGAVVESEHGYLIAHAPSLIGAQVFLDFPSVGATENLLMAGVLAKGTTVIDNAAREPEIVDLCEMLTQMGARIGGAGTSTLEIDGVDSLRPTRHATVPDRIVVGTFAMAAAMSRGDITIRGARSEHLELVLYKLTEAGAVVETSRDSLRVTMDRRPRSVDVVTLPYPGFPTDLQPMAMALAAVSDGAAMITENIFEARFMFVDELIRLGADVRTDGHHAVVRGREKLSGAPVRATDVRAGAGLVLAGTVADGVTEVSDIFHIDRGYAGFAEQLRDLGADVMRTTAEDPFDF
ncbi:MAG TPA: UDP-N-acetylglucosamine 1-carboxyvinyltransferase [Mycobacteriales bacterium]|nr:UDP-N-acetylglucosamine 1-carboxyvinyltransferase [Mycobacteriales bacterium]